MEKGLRGFNMYNKGLNTSYEMNYGTPLNLFKFLDNKYHFDLDPCTDKYNRLKTKFHYTPTDNGLIKDWFGCVFVNPPYGRKIKNWIMKAYNEKYNCNVIVMLIPSRTDTKYWHDYVMKANEIIFIRGRLTFNLENNVAPFPSCIVIYKCYDTKLTISTLDYKDTMVYYNDKFTNGQKV